MRAPRAVASGKSSARIRIASGSALGAAISSKNAGGRTP
jgi:hypothetical protein